MAEGSMLQQRSDELKDEYMESKREEASKNMLIDKLFKQIDELHTALKNIESDLQKERDLEELYSQRAKEYEGKLQSLQQEIACMTFVSVLVDGDCMQFRDDLVQQGEDGGREAARLFKCAVKEHIKDKIPNLAHSTQILIRVYANTKGLAKTYRDANIVSELSSLEVFIRGFNMEDPLCDFNRYNKEYRQVERPSCF
ncbi:CCCH zinc finger DNA binding protein [Xylogone sp. PMI_703]|nr:CCCH zinc finger DNA binding protein [Xylogone sp. PMI_703]